jgi:hypothetical protein
VTLEMQAAATFFTANNVSSAARRAPRTRSTRCRARDLRVSIRHLGFVDGTYFAGGRTTIDGGLETTTCTELAFRATLALPVDRLNSIKFHASSVSRRRTGNNFDLIGVAWQYRWGGGL